MNYQPDRNNPVTEKPNFLKEAWENLKYETKLAAEPGMEKFDIWEGAQFQPLGPKGTRGVRTASIPSEESLMMGDINPAYRMDQITLPETRAETRGNDPSINNLEAKNIEGALIQQRNFERKDKAPHIYGTLTPYERKLYDKSLRRDKEEKIYRLPVLTVAQGGRVGYFDGGIAGLL